ncbi:hypothetical protein EVAR_86423_1 [Eumeta japonica]|uniref:Uncharacterized protein n=1 Tax=Eumeta variegata TaxID=151549 RepID=A0A4C1ZCT5_EUMVA|nr:hypothetical protein EVAR_86423_1 [Eumeta japonica]
MRDACLTSRECQRPPADPPSVLINPDGGGKAVGQRGEVLIALAPALVNSSRFALSQYGSSKFTPIKLCGVATDAAFGHMTGCGNIAGYEFQTPRRIFQPTLKLNHAKTTQRIGMRLQPFDPESFVDG